jgi:integrase
VARIRQHRSKWQVLYRDPATGRERSAGVFARKSDATRQRRAVEYRLQTGEWIDPELQATAYYEWATRWLPTKANLKPKTLERYESLLNRQILPRFGSVRLRDINAIEIEQWMADMHTNGLSDSSIKQARSLLSSTLKAAVRNGIIASNPVDGVTAPRTSRKEMRFINPAELRSLSEEIPEEIPEEYRTLVLTLGYTGMRQGELTALRRKRINLLRREIVVAESATDVHGKKVLGETKNRQARIIGIPTFLVSLLSEHLEAVPADPDALLFTSASGSPMGWSNFRKRVWNPAVVRASLAPLRMHDLRHTAASVLIAQGCQPKFIQEHLGHSSIVVTMDRYGHLYPEARSEVSDAFDTAFASAQRKPA